MTLNVYDQILNNVLQEHDKDKGTKELYLSVSLNFRIV